MYTCITQVLQLCAFVKSMRNFRLVGSLETGVVPPWTLPLAVAGNTFLHTNPEFAPKVGRLRGPFLALLAAMHTVVALQH